MGKPVTADLPAQLRAICCALPEVTERASHGAPTWFVRGKSAFVTLWAHGHHDHAFPHLWCAGLPGAQDELVSAEPGRFFRPPYVGKRGWIGIRLDGDLDWPEVAELCQDAYRAVAPLRLATLLDGAPAGPPATRTTAQADPHPPRQILLIRGSLWRRR